jgi:hypothetical protein
MGMFDSLKVSRDLPVSDEVAKLGIQWAEEVFQTKDLDNILGYYEITKDGRLRQLRSRLGWAEGEDQGAGGEAELPHDESEEWVYVNHHGRVRFYAGHCDSPEYRWDYSKDSAQMSWADIMGVEGYDWWIEFEATFDNGLVREIKMLPVEKCPIRVRLANSKEWAERRDAEDRKPCARLARQLRRIPGWRKFIRGVIRAESAGHTAVSTVLHKIA